MAYTKLDLELMVADGCQDPELLIAIFALQDNQWNVCKKRREQLQFPNAAQGRAD